MIKLTLHRVSIFNITINKSYHLLDEYKGPK